MTHVLDNPAWNALVSDNKNLGTGNHQVRYFDRDVSPFAAFCENTTENFQALYNTLPANSTVLFVSPIEIEIPQPWQIAQFIPGWQMVYDGVTQLPDVEIELTTLTPEHVPQMLALTKLTNPGPFAERTIEFGHYRGVFDGDKLVAMAGQRLHFFGHAEISAVCTHPDHLGRGYAKQLLLYQLHRIIAAAEIPLLHVRYDNDRAIEVYERVDFKKRTKVYFYVLKK